VNKQKDRNLYLWNKARF